MAIMNYRIVKNGLGEYGVEKQTTEYLGDDDFITTWKLEPERYKTQEDALNAVRVELLGNKWEVVGEVVK